MGFELIDGRIDIDALSGGKSLYRFEFSGDFRRPVGRFGLVSTINGEAGDQKNGDGRNVNPRWKAGSIQRWILSE